MMSKEQECLLKTIQMSSFAVLDTALFLDTHPNCDEALNHYKKMSKVLREAYDKYQETYGPLNIFDEMNTEEWTWNKTTWPWTGGNC